jgi:serine/threonine-protein kinase RsbW
VTNDHVTLAMPAAPQYVRLARLTAAGLASRIGFTYDEIEDMRIAVDELCYLLVGPVGHDGDVQLRFDLDDDGLTITGEVEQSAGDVEFAQLSKQILTAVVDRFEVMNEGGTVRFRIVRNHRA